jgi:protein required for attachment to host cells
MDLGCATRKNQSQAENEKGHDMAQLHWILVANGAHARLFERRSFTEPLLELTDWVNPAGRMSARETERAPLGQSQAGRAGLAPRADLKQLHRSAFAQELAAHLREAVLSHRMKALALIVSNPFLGELLSHLDASVQKVLFAQHVLDLTSLSLTDLDERMRSDFRL